MPGPTLGQAMSKRAIWSIILILLAVTVMLLNRGVIGGLVGTFFLLAMLLMWSIPSNPSTSSHGQNKGPGMKRISQAVLGIGLGLCASITAVLVLPPQLFPWVIMAVGIGLIIWIVMSSRRG